jgi:8-oxo-dGTP diphosphatase
MNSPHTAILVMPQTTVDVVIFTVLDDALQVLLVQRAHATARTTEPYPGLWALPGGFVNPALDHDLLACAGRKLLEKTGIVSPYLEQLGSWGNATRDPRGWSATHAYFSLISAAEMRLTKGVNTADVAWFQADEVLQRSPHTPEKPLAFDHQHILQTAVERLRSKVEYTSLPAYLLLEPFTLPQLQHIYEVVLGRPIDKSAFRTRMLGANFLSEVGTLTTTARRSPMGYRLKNREYPMVFARTFIR